MTTPTFCRASILLLFANLTLQSSAAAPSQEASIQVGFARIEVNPRQPVRLMGYASRRTESTNVHSSLYARAMAIGTGPQTALLLTADNCILPANLTSEIRRRLKIQADIAPERIAIAVNHTHNAPSLTGAAPNLFVENLPPEQIQRIADYTQFFIERLHNVAVAALSNRQPARVGWGRGQASFAANRRTPGGPVDHDVPLLNVVSPDGKPIGFLLNYACHCTTLGDFNQSHPDWTGVCARELESQFPGTIALTAIGCGADANPSPRGGIDHVEAHGKALAREAALILKQDLVPISSPPECKSEILQLPYQTHFTRAQWLARSTNSGIVGFHARKWLARLDRGETLPPTLPYPVQTWVFGETLAMVFLGGEVVVDYSLRLKNELDPTRLWVNAYANDVPCYIPSRRILKEGGYEAESSLWYYDRPQQLSPTIEDMIVDAVRRQLPKSYIAERSVLEHPKPQEAEASRRLIRVPPGLKTELAAAEPLVKSPVAIDFGADGSVWVAEMYDYPEGLDGRGAAGGRIKRLQDTNGDGRMDVAEYWATDVPFPTGLMAWETGVLVAAAPDLLFLTPDPSEIQKVELDGIPVRSTRRQVLLTGFATHNYQARLNGFRWGYDGWIYASGGLFGGEIRSPKTGQSWEGKGRDFRFHPKGLFEPLSGASQQGRTRDDFGNWFGNDNSTLLRLEMFPDRYSTLNTALPPPQTLVSLARGTDFSRVYPRSRTLERFNDFSTANHITSACGPEIYRDNYLGAEYEGNAFICEPVHNLVRRAILVPEGPSLGAERADTERRSEFLSSSDNWFRPVEIRTGPDGALWVVDFYREVIEHPRWIPAERLKSIDPRGGANRGRIYRIVPEKSPIRPLPRVAGATGTALAAAFAGTNGPLRDLADLYIRSQFERGTLATELPTLAQQMESQRETFGPGARVHWEWLKSAFPILNLSTNGSERLLHDPNPRVRRAMLPLLENNNATRPIIEPKSLESLASDPDVGVRFQLALTTGRLLQEVYHSRTNRGLPALVPQPTVPDSVSESLPGILMTLALRPMTNTWERTAVLQAFGQVAPRDLSLIARSLHDSTNSEFTTGLLRTAASRQDLFLTVRITETLFPNLDRLDPTQEAKAFQWQAAVSAYPKLVLQLTQLGGQRAGLWQRFSNQLRQRATTLILDPSIAPDLRTAAATVLGQAQTLPEFQSIIRLLATPLPPSGREPLVAGLRNGVLPAIAAELLSDWSTLGPTIRAERLGILFTRENWIEKLLDSVRRGEVSASELTPNQRQQLLSHANESIRAQAKRLFPPVTSDRSSIVAKFANMDLPSNAQASGFVVFEKHCASCHRLRGVGHPVGPDLTPYRAKPLSDLVTAIFAPNAAIEPRFSAQQVELRNGRSLTGIITDESSAGFTLHQPAGLSESIPRSEVSRLIASPLSLMPEGFENLITRDEIAALSLWIGSAPQTLGSTGVAAGLDAQRELSKLGVSRIRLVTAAEPVMPYPSWLSPLPLRYCRQTDGQSFVRWQAKPLARQSDRSDSLLRFRFAVGTGFISQSAGGFQFHIGPSIVVPVEAVTDDAQWSSADGRVKLRYNAREANTEDSCGLLEVEISPEAVGDSEWTSFAITGAAARSQRWFGIYEVPGTLD